MKSAKIESPEVEVILSLYLLIIDSLGTQELMLVALVALLIFGPRKIPELARKAGKIVTELRQVSNEFRSTWEREVNLDENEKKAFDFSDESLEIGTIAPPDIKTEPEIGETTAQVASNTPEVREISDPDKIEQLKSQSHQVPDESSDKQNWL